MYGMVLMVAVTGSGDTSSFGGRNKGCNGCDGAVVVAGCDGNSCHGGGFLGLRNRDRSGCHGGGFLGLRNRHSCDGGGCTGAPAPACCPTPAPAPCAAPAPAPCAPACAPACTPACDPCAKKGLFHRICHRKDKCCPTACTPACDPCAGAVAPTTPPVTEPKAMPTPMPKKEKE